MLSKNTYRVQRKGKANQKQQLSDYGCITILAAKNFDIKLRQRLS